MTVLTPQGCALKPACSTVPTVTPRRCSGLPRWGRTSCHPARRCHSSCQRQPPAPWGTSKATGAPAGWWPGSCRDPSAAWQRAWTRLGTASMGTNRWVLEATDDGQLLIPRELPSTLAFPISTPTLALSILLPHPHCVGTLAAGRAFFLEHCPCPALPGGQLLFLDPHWSHRWENHACCNGFGFAPESLHLEAAAGTSQQLSFTGRRSPCAAREALTGTNLPQMPAWARDARLCHPCHLCPPAPCAWSVEG